MGFIVCSFIGLFVGGIITDKVSSAVNGITKENYLEYQYYENKCKTKEDKDMIEQNYVISYNGKQASISRKGDVYKINDTVVDEESYNNAIDVLNDEGSMVSKINSIEDILDEYKALESGNSTKENETYSNLLDSLASFVNLLKVNCEDINLETLKKAAPTIKNIGEVLVNYANKIENK